MTSPSLAPLGILEEQVLVAVLRGGDEAYGMEVRREIETVTRREVAIGAVYATLDRLEAKELVRSRRVTLDGASRRVFQLTKVGARALADTREMRERLWRGIDLARVLGADEGAGAGWEQASARATHTAAVMERIGRVGIRSLRRSAAPGFIRAGSFAVCSWRVRASPVVSPVAIAVQHRYPVSPHSPVARSLWFSAPRDAISSCRNALIPMVTLVALNFGALLSGVVVVETIFALDGMGLYFVNALNAGDPYPIMAWLMITATMIIVFNLVADIAYGVLDPRVRLA